MPAEAVTRMPVLDVWRGIAVLWVVAYHAEEFLGFDLARISGSAHGLLRLGFLAVDFFFVLSGFLITGLLLKDFESKVNWKRFYTRRALKIAPAYLALTLVGLLISYGLPVIETRVGPSRIPNGAPFSYFLFLQNYFVQLPVLAHSWSLAVEEHFYLIMPWLLISAAWVAKSLRVKHPRIVLGAFLVGLMLIATIARALLLPDAGSAEWYKNHPLPFQMPLLRIDALMFGCLMRLLPDNWAGGKSQWGRWLVQVIGLLLPVVALGYFLKAGFNVFDWRNYSIAYLAAGTLLAVTCGGQGGVGSLLERIPGIQRIGRWSYGIYLWHYPLLFAFAPLQGISRLVGIGYICLSVLIGMISTNTLEAGFLRLRSRLCP